MQRETAYGLVLLIITLAVGVSGLSPTGNLCSYTDSTYVPPYTIVVGQYYLPFADNAWIGDVIKPPYITYGYYWDSQTKTLFVMFYNQGSQGSYVTYYFTTKGACPVNRSTARIRLELSTRPVDTFLEFDTSRITVLHMRLPNGIEMRRYVIPLRIVKKLS